MTQQSCSKPGTYLYSSKEDAERVLEAMVQIIDGYGIISVADLNDLVGLPSTYVDNKWGWSKLINVHILQEGEKYSIDLPPVEAT